jgi:hypothetical protein
MNQSESEAREDRKWPTRRFEVIFWNVFVLIILSCVWFVWFFLGVGVNSPPGS